jgi:hypothetical protein
MFKQFLVFIFFFAHIVLFGQSSDLEQKLNAQQEQEKLEKQSENKKDTLTTDYYKIYYVDGRVESVDTSLNIYKDYKFNFLRQDSFELLEMPNVGSSYNKLGYTFNKRIDYPKLGARGKHFHYYESEDIGYYKVPTPYTEILAKSSFEQGQILDAIISINLSPEFNFTLAHKGYKSLGKYINTRSRGNQFRFSTNFNSKNKKSKLKFHITSQNMFNQESGGLTPDGIYFFEQAPNYFVLDNFGNQIENEDGSFEMIEYDGYLDRSRLPSWLLSDSSLYSKRVFADFNRSIIYNNEKESSVLSLGLQFKHEYKKLEYDDPYTSTLFGEVEEGIIVSDQSRYILQKSVIYLVSDFNKFGKLKMDYSLINSNNNYKDYDGNLSGLIFNLDNKQSNFSSEWIKDFSFFKIELNINKSLKEEMVSNYTSITLKTDKIKNIEIKFNALSAEKSPNLNHIFFRSAYKNYNWYNSNLENQKSSSLSAELSFKELIKISGEYSIIDNYIFFRESTNALNGEIDNFRKVDVNQINSQINYFKIKLFSKVDFGKFSFINTGQYQKKDQELVLDELSTLNVPEWVTRNTIMFSNYIFNKSLFFQTGFTFNYFTKFYADYYNPLLSEFVTQNYKEIGNYPRVDFFFNAKIQQTRVFLKVEHLNSSFSGYDYYSDPFNPYRDLSVRFGLVWNFFQ